MLSDLPHIQKLFKNNEKATTKENLFRLT